MICHYWFFNHRFKFQDSVCNGCHDLEIWSVNISDIAIITVKNIDYRCIIDSISKSETTNFFRKFCTLRSWIYRKNIVLIFSLLKTDFFFFFFFSLFKMVYNEYSMDIYKSVKISTGTVARNREMLKFVPDHLKYACRYLGKFNSCLFISNVCVSVWSISIISFKNFMFIHKF